MPVLEINTEVERVYLPMTADLEPDDPNKAWADIIVGPMTAGDIRGLDDKNTDAMSVSFIMIANRIMAWNLTDKNGEPHPITSKIVEALPTEDYKVLADKITSYRGLTDEEKKS